MDYNMGSTLAHMCYGFCLGYFVVMDCARPRLSELLVGCYFGQCPSYTNHVLGLPLT